MVFFLGSPAGGTRWQCRSDCGPCYHQACDTFVNNSATALEINSDAIAYATLRHAMLTEAINGRPGKDNFSARKVAMDGELAKWDDRGSHLQR